MSVLRRFALFGDFSARSLPRRMYSTLPEGASPTLRIPLIDFSAFRANGALSEKRRVADNIVKGFREAGFIYMSGHGIPAGTIGDIFNKSAAFFNLPQEVKDRIAWEDPRANRGYVRVGRERVTQSMDAAEIAALRAKAPDMKETMELGRDWDPVWKNKWPDETDAPGFRHAMLGFFQTCHELYVAVMRAVALGLDLDESYFDHKIDHQQHNLRLLLYPSVSAKLLLQQGQARAHAHSDYGAISLLFQDSVGGLEVQDPHTKQFQPVVPIPGTIVLNVGDLLARWSNDVLRSTLHRVVAPPLQKNDPEGMTPTRRTVACFCRPNFNETIETLPTCITATNPSKYGPVNSGEYVVGRLAATY